MRIISGRWRSRTIEWPEHGVTRPIADRARAALFDGLGSHFATPGTLPRCRVADVFAGGGSLGLEALSRGAAEVCFFERDAEAIRVLKRNLARLDAGPNATVVAADVWRSGVRAPDGGEAFDLVFLDPPFADSRDLSLRSKLGVLLRRIAAGAVTTPDALVVLRIESRSEPPETFGRHWVVTRRRTYGASRLCFLARPPVEAVRTGPAVEGTADEPGSAS